jgi:hypothetical protein
VRTDLLAIAAQDMENRLRPMRIFPSFCRNRVPRLLGPSERQALDIGKRYGVRSHQRFDLTGLGIRSPDIGRDSQMRLAGTAL